MKRTETNCFHLPFFSPAPHREEDLKMCCATCMKVVLDIQLYFVLFLCFKTSNTIKLVTCSYVSCTCFVCQFTTRDNRETSVYKSRSCRLHCRLPASTLLLKIWFGMHVTSNLSLCWPPLKLQPNAAVLNISDFSGDYRLLLTVTSASDRLLGLRVWISQTMWTSVTCDCCVLCRQRHLLRADHSFRGGLRCVIVCDLETSKTRRPCSALVCCARRK